MKTPRTDKLVDVPRLFRHLDSAHAELVAARKIAALSKHESYEEIGDAIECVVAASVRLHSLLNAEVSHGDSCCDH